MDQKLLAAMFVIHREEAIKAFESYEKTQQKISEIERRTKEDYGYRDRVVLREDLEYKDLCANRATYISVATLNALMATMLK